MIKIIFISYLFFSLNVFAKTGEVTGLDIPRFVSLKSNDINLRVGPSTNYPINIKYLTKNLPVEVIDEFDVWRKIKDYKNNYGWLHKSLIKGNRFVLTNEKKNLGLNIYNRPNSKIIGIIKKNNILELNKCLKDWCNISYNNFSGWIKKENIWGVYEKEIYNIKFYQPLINQYWRILDSKWFN
jgi:SH3-like domain-containing protein